jgi:L-lactate dehydrogenase (cytochrome)
MGTIKKCLTVEDLRQRAQRRLPKMFFDYIESGSWQEQSLARNRLDLDAIGLTQRVAAGLPALSARGQMLGQDVRLPCAIAPTGLGGMMYADGEIHAARAAQNFGVPYTLSTMSICAIEDVALAVEQPFWFQLYVMRDRDFCFQLIDRARAVNCSALVLTVDLPLMGQRHRDIRNGLSAPPKPTLANLLDLATRPAWVWDFISAKHRGFGNIKSYENAASDTASLSAWIGEQFDPGISWDDVARFREHWGDRPFIVKGIMHPADAEAAIQAGADAIVVSNHGGRQLDGAASPISALPEIVQRVGGSAEIWMDSGIRSGQDLLKALALGAKGVMLGRAFLYGLAAGGEAGVTRCLEIIEQELISSMGLCGVGRIDDITSAVIAARR